MSNPLRSARSWVLAGLLFAGGAAAPLARAQSFGNVDDSKPTKQERILPPDPGNPTPPNTGLLYLVLFVFLGAAVGLSILPSPRTHQD